MGIFELTGGYLISAATTVGETLGLFVKTVASIGAAFTHPRRVIYQMLRVGWESFPIVALMAVFTGMVVAL